MATEACELSGAHAASSTMRGGPHALWDPLNGPKGGHVAVLRFRQALPQGTTKGCCYFVLQHVYTPYAAGARQRNRGRIVA
jgi:hypothetical protein